LLSREKYVREVQRLSLFGIFVHEIQRFLTPEPQNQEFPEIKIGNFLHFWLFGRLAPRFERLAISGYKNPIAAAQVDYLVAAIAQAPQEER